MSTNKDLVFDKNRYRTVKECPCGKSNKNGRFVPILGETDYGYCHTCKKMFRPPKDGGNAPITNAKQEYIDPNILVSSQLLLQKNIFFTFMYGMIGDEDETLTHLKRMNVGSDGEYTVFWLVDQYGRVCQPKRFKYDQEGNRDKNFKEYVRSEFSSANSYYPCLFNASAIGEDPDAMIVVVESEKTAVIGQWFFPDFIWVSAGGSSGLSYDKAIPLKGRNVVILYDSDESGRTGADRAKETLERLECNVSAFDLFPERIDGYDIADLVYDRHEDKEFMDSFIRNRIKKEFDRLLHGDVDELEEGIIEMDIDWLINRYINDLKDRGETSHFHELDHAFKWKRGLVYTYTGYAGTGKSEINLFLCMLKAMRDKWKFILFVPESMSSDDRGMMTVEEAVDTLVHIYWGKPVDIRDAMSVSKEEYREALGFIKDHFTIIYPKKGLCTQDDVIKQAEYTIKTRGKYDAIIIDPFNNIRSSMERNELIDDYLRRLIADAKIFAVNNRMSWIYVTHPSKQPRGSGGKVPDVDMDSIRGGMAFGNGSDFVIVIKRPYYFDDEVEYEGNLINGRNHPLVHFQTRKVKNQKLLGCRPNTIEIIFNRITNRYENEFKVSPFDEEYKAEMTAMSKYGSSLPDSKSGDTIVTEENFDEFDFGLGDHFDNEETPF